MSSRLLTLTTGLPGAAWRGSKAPSATCIALLLFAVSCIESSAPERRIDRVAIDAEGRFFADGRIVDSWMELEATLSSQYQRLEPGHQRQPEVRVACAAEAPARLLAELITLAHGEARFRIRLRVENEEVSLPAMGWWGIPDCLSRPPDWVLQLGRYDSSSRLGIAYGFRPSEFSSGDAGALISEAREWSELTLFGDRQEALIVVDEGVQAHELATLGDVLLSAGYSWHTIEVGKGLSSGQPGAASLSPDRERTPDMRVESLSIDSAGSVIAAGRGLPSTWPELQQTLSAYEPVPSDVELEPVVKVHCEPDSPAQLLARLITFGHGERRFRIELDVGDDEVRLPAMAWSEETELPGRRPPRLTFCLGRYYEDTALIAAFGFRPHSSSIVYPSSVEATVEEVRAAAQELLFEAGLQETIIIVNEDVRAHELATLVSDAHAKGYPVVRIEPGGRWPKEGAECH